MFVFPEFRRHLLSNIDQLFFGKVGRAFWKLQVPRMFRATVASQCRRISIKSLLRNWFPIRRRDRLYKRVKHASHPENNNAEEIVAFRKVILLID